MSNNFQNYILITPCKNEAKNIPNLTLSIEAQTIKPVLWVVVDDGSTDDTKSLIQKNEAKYNWIKGIFLTEHNEYLGQHYAVVCNEGFEFTKRYCQNNNILYNYIALVDADNILESKYFEKLMIEFENDSDLGIASGKNAYAKIEELMDELRIGKSDINVIDLEFWELYGSSCMPIQEGRENIPIGSARMWRKKCFEETSGYLMVSAPDAVSNVKAKLKGWKTKRFASVRVIERAASVKHGAWKGYNEIGNRFYLLWYPFSLAILKALKFSFKRPYYIGIAFFLGYLKSVIDNDKRIDDKEIQQYYQQTRPKELMNYYIGFLKK